LLIPEPVGDREHPIICTDIGLMALVAAIPALFEISAVENLLPPAVEDTEEVDIPVAN
jgi:hypothetical protein